MNNVSTTTENATEEQAVSRWTTCWRGRTGVVIVIFAFLILMGVVALTLLLVMFGLSKSCRTKHWKADCSPSLAAKICGGAFVLIFLGGGLATIVVLRKRRRKRSSTEIAVSRIPPEDLEKSPAPVLPYNHIPNRSPFGEASSIALPDYFTAVQNVHEVSSQLNNGFWTEDIDADSDDEHPPPCYEEALKMTTLPATATNQEKQHKQGNSEVTRM